MSPDNVQPVNSPPGHTDQRKIAEYLTPLKGLMVCTLLAKKKTDFDPVTPELEAVARVDKVGEGVKISSGTFVIVKPDVTVYRRGEERIVIIQEHEILAIVSSASIKP